MNSGSPATTRALRQASWCALGWLGYWGAQMVCAAAWVTMRFWMPDIEMEAQHTTMLRLFRVTNWAMLGMAGLTLRHFFQLRAAEAVVWDRASARRATLARKWLATAEVFVAIRLLLAFGGARHLPLWLFTTPVISFGFFTLLRLGFPVAFSVWHWQLAEWCRAVGEAGDRPVIRARAAQAVRNWKIVLGESLGLALIGAVLDMQKSDFPLAAVFWPLLVSFILFAQIHLAALLRRSARAVEGG